MINDMIDKNLQRGPFDLDKKQVHSLCATRLEAITLQGQSFRHLLNVCKSRAPWEHKASPMSKNSFLLQWKSILGT